MLPAGDAVFRQGMMAHLRFLEQAQWWDRERLFAARDARLQSLMKTAYFEVPFYRALMDNARVTWRDFRSPEDLRKLPVVTKDMLRAGYPHLTTRDTGARAYETSSSGSTGANFHVREDAPTAGWYRAAFLLALEWAGWRIGEPHLQTGMTLDRTWDRRLKDRLLSCHYVSAFDLSDAHLDDTLALMERDRIRHLWGYPGSLYFLAQRALERGWNRPLQSVVTWGDSLYPRYRAAIERAFRVRVFDTYGCGEGIQIAAQCGHASHYHIFTPDVVVEFLDDEGAPAARGVTANLIVTRLWPGPMPLIRYRIGDLGVVGPEETCLCGRTLRAAGFDSGPRRRCGPDARRQPPHRAFLHRRAGALPRNRVLSGGAGRARRGSGAGGGGARLRCHARTRGRDRAAAARPRNGRHGHLRGAGEGDPGGAVRQAALRDPRNGSPAAMTVSVIVPCRNEIRHIHAFLRSLEAQQLPDGVDWEVFIADGMSRDGTRAVLEEYRAAHPFVTVIENRGEIVSTGLNEAIRRARGEVVVRMDVHTEYAPDYIAQCLAVLEETGAENVGGPARTMAAGYMQGAIARAYHSGFACGGARFHNPAYEGYVDTVTFGCWRRQTLLDLGLFDEALVRNQDDELNLRLVRRGGTHLAIAAHPLLVQAARLAAGRCSGNTASTGIGRCT